MARNTPVSLVLLVVLVVLAGVSAQGKGDDLASRISNLVWAQKIGTITDVEFKDYLRKLLDDLPAEDINESRDTDGRTALHWAAANGLDEVMGVLIDRGADIHARCGLVGQTALHFASRWGHETSAKLLIAKGCKVGEKDMFGKSPLDMARAGKHEHMYDALAS